MSLKILHTSDIHIGAKFGFLGVKSNFYRQVIESTFERIINFAISNKFDVFLISGDLFDSPIPSDVRLSFVVNNLQKLSDNGIRIAIIAGNHDMLTPSSVYVDSRIRNIENLKVFNSEGERWVLDDLDLAIYGVSNDSKRSNQSPLSKLEVVNETRYNVAMVHGTYVMGQKTGTPNYPITAEEIRSSGFDYIAMGDWHGFQDFSIGKTSAVYSGSPEPLDFSQDKSGYISIVEIREDDKNTKKHHIGKVRIAKETVQLDQGDTTERAMQLLKQLSGSYNALVLSVESVEPVDVEELENMFSKDFLYLRIMNKVSAMDSRNIEEGIKENPILGSYLEKIEEVLKERSDMEAVKDDAISDFFRRLK